MKNLFKKMTALLSVGLTLLSLLALILIAIAQAVAVVAAIAVITATAAQFMSIKAAHIMVMEPLGRMLTIICSQL